LHGGDHAGQRPEHARGLARRLDTRWRLRVHASQTRCFVGYNRHGEAVAADSGAIHPRLSPLHREIVNQIPRLEVVRPVENAIGVGEKVFYILGSQVGDQRRHMALRRNPLQMICRRGGFRHSIRRIGLFVQPLPLQITDLDKIAVNECQVTDAGSGQCSRLERTQRTAADNGGARRDQPGLPLFPNASKPNLARVTLGLVRSHTTRW
jgi:hypothetical protein